jgi:tetratricopeptide (TPR) repeat protein
MDERAALPEQSDSRSRTATCALCRVVSTLPELFQRGPTGAQRVGLLCPRCIDEVQTSHGRWQLQAMFIVVAICGLLAARGFPDAGLVLSSVAVGFFLTILLTPLHEFAHALMALLLGLPVYGIVIGWYGKRLGGFQVGRCAFEVRRIPVGGATYVAHSNESLIRTKAFLVSLAGPLLHVLLAYASWIFLRHADEFESVPDWLLWLTIVFGLANVFAIVINLWPRHISSPFGDVANDGMSLLTIPFAPMSEIEAYHLGYFQYEVLSRLRSKDQNGALECCRSGLERFPGNFNLLYLQGYLLLVQERLDEARRIFDDLRTHPELTPENRALLLNHIAWTALISWSPDALKQADDFSRQALAALPWLPEVKGTRGSVLVVAGDVEPGIELLREAFAENVDPDSRALNAAFLALGSARLGEFDAARESLRKAEELDPDCNQLARISRDVDALAGSGAASAT